MALTAPLPLEIPIFAGQGTPSANTPQTRQRVLLDASLPSGSILLSACFEAFHAELSALSPIELLKVDVDTAEFNRKETLLALPAQRYLQNPVITGSSLFLIQSLRYLAHIEVVGISTGSLTPFSDVLKRNLEHGLGVLGFSSGILPACVVGTSLSAIAFLTRAVEAYRLAIWIGIRTQIYRADALSAASLNEKVGTLPWSLVFVGMNRAYAEEAIGIFSKDLETPSLYITAVMNGPCVTISGRPDVLSAFSGSLTTGSPVHKTTVDTLYHSPIHANGVREYVLADAASRNIQFPDFSDIKVPIRSTYTGDAITRDTTAASLLELVLDMLLTQPVNWDLVLDKVVKSVPCDVPVRLLNIGPGAGLKRSMERLFPRGAISSLDLTIADVEERPQAKAKQEPIAIVGMAVNMPGAENTTKLWEVLEQGINTIREIPEHRFKVSDYNDGKNSNRMMKAHTGNFVDGVDEFDHKFFKISPREAKSMDPQQRILLHTAYEALEDSGYVPNSTPTSKPETFGCYIGVATHDYLQNLRNDIDVYYSTGTLKAFLSGRISYAMQMSGPSIVVDTACSSSNVALYQGARALMNGDCNAAMVGGVNVISSPDMFLGLDRGHFLSPTGQCKAFDESADGYSRSEGCGIFILKRLSDAVAENDHILGVIRGIEVNQSGLAHSITHPHAPTQATLFKRVIDNAGIEASRVNVVEAHGTGTQAGDPNELESIRSVFANGRTSDNPLHITSIKANLGHLEAASGAAGLAKLLLMLQHKTIPQQISLKNLNSRIAPLESDNTVIDTVHTPWLPSHKDMTRVALLNNFGAAGSNTALLIEEHQVAAPDMSQPDGMHFVLGLSAKDNVALEELRSKYVRWFQSPESLNILLSDIAYTSTARRQIYDSRLSISVSSRDELVQKLRTATIARTPSKPNQAVFVFSGQGSQYLGMGHSLYQTSPLFKSHIDDCHAILTAAGFPGIHAIITAGTASGLPPLEEFEAYQAAIFSLEYALASLWISWGLVPAAVVGHSLGEYAALVIANVLSLKSALMIVANRVRLMVQRCAVDATGMIAVNLGPAALEDALGASSTFSALSISCYNSATDCVVSGPLPKLKKFKEHLDTEVRCKNVLLSVPFGYHSSAMAPLLEDLYAITKHVTLHAPTIPIISNVLGEIVLPGDDSVFDAAYFSRHCAEPVQFDSGIRALMANSSFASVGVWIEIGPHTSTLPVLKSHATFSQDVLLLGSLRKQQEAWATLTASLSQLYVSGVALDWRKVFAHLIAPSCVSLPSYPFSKAKFWVDFKESKPASDAEPARIEHSRQSLITEYSMLHIWAQHPSNDNGCVAVFETPISQLAGSIRGHSVGGMPLCPASVYLEQVFAGINLACHHLGIQFDDHHVVLRKIEFVKPLVYDENVERTVITTITVRNGFGIFSVGSRVDASSEESIHAHGEYRLQFISQTSKKFTHKLPVIARHMAAVARPKGGQAPEVFSTRTAYEVIFPRVVDYAGEYRTMRSVTVDATGLEGCANIRLPADHDRGKFVVHPVFMDTLLHVAGFVANMQGDANDAYICSEVGSVKVLPHLVDNNASYLVYCSIAWVPQDQIMLAEAYAVQRAEPRQILAHLKDMHFHRVRLDRFKRGLIYASGKSSLTSPLTARNAHSAIPAVHPESRISHRPLQDTSVLVPDIQGDITRIVSEACDLSIADIGVNTGLASLGVDSLMSIEILAKLANTFPDADLDAQVLSYCNDIADIIREVSTSIGRPHSVIRGESPVTQPSGGSSPRTLVTDDKLLDPPTLVVDGEPDVKHVLASVLGIKLEDIQEDTDFESLGLDSLTSIEAVHALKNEFGLDLPNDFFTNFQTARVAQSYFSAHLRANTGLIEHLHKKTVVPESMERGAEMAESGLVKALRLDTVPTLIQNSKSERLPLFLIHDGSGLVNYYDRLSSLERSIWGIHNPRFATAQPWDDIAQMATAYADYIQSTTTGPVLLGGWSFGGVAAYEIALQLTKRRVRVQGILLIDSPSPINHVPLSDSLIESFVNLDSRSAGSELGRLVKTQFALNARMLGKYKPQATGGACPPLVLLRSKEGYNPSAVSNVPAWLADRTDPKLATAGWEALAGAPVKVMDIPGHHFQPFHPLNIGEVSVRIGDACELLERLK